MGAGGPERRGAGGREAGARNALGLTKADRMHIVLALITGIITTISLGVLFTGYMKTRSRAVRRPGLHSDNLSPAAVYLTGQLLQ